MIALNNDSILIGQIKLLLHDFNLPRCQIGKENPIANNHFIYNNDLYVWDNNLQPKWICRYLYNQAYLNITDNLEIQNMKYDRYTHRYLGKYLKFLRDYNNIDLMSMYNCMDNDPIIHDIAISYKSSIEMLVEQDSAIDLPVKTFLKNDPAYISYQVPISYGKELTLFLHAETTFEVFMYWQPQTKKLTYADKYRKAIGAATYRKYRSNAPIYYNPTNIALLFIDQIAQIEGEEIAEIYRKYLREYSLNLAIIIKVPKSMQLSVVVLEGKYLAKNYKNTYYLRYQPVHNPNKPYDKDNVKIVKRYNLYIGIYKPDQLVITQADKNEDKPPYYNYILESGFLIVSELLSYENTFGNYLLADRLAEYLVNNPINPLSISDEIKRLQLTLDSMRDFFGSSQLFNVKENKGSKSSYKIFYVKASENSDEMVPFYVRTTATINLYNPPNRHYGIWDNLDLQDLRSLLYQTNTYIDYDRLGYLDKDLENILKEQLDSVSI